MRQRRRRQRHSLTTLAELDVTPLLDLAFVLLIIFMITAPFLAESADLIIPTSKASRDAVDPEAVFVISIDNQRRLSLDNEELTLEAIVPRLVSLRDTKGDLAIIIRSDRDLPVQAIVDIMDALKAVDITKVGIVTKPAQ